MSNHYMPMLLDDEEYKTVWNYYKERINSNKGPRKFSAIKQMLVYDLANRWAVRPVWLTDFKFKHVNFDTGVIDIQDISRLMDSHTLELFKMAEENYPGIVNEDQLVLFSQKRNLKISYQSVSNILRTTYKNVGIPYVNRAKHISMNQTRIGKKSRRKVKYDCWEDFVCDKVIGAYNNAKYRQAKPHNKRIGKQFGFESKEHMAEWVIDRLERNNYKCEITGVDLNYQHDSKQCLSFDRKDSLYGYNPQNVQLVSRLYNFAKMDNSDQEMYNMALDMVCNKLKDSHVEFKRFLQEQWK